MSVATPPALIMGFKPSSHGFGWIAFSGPFSIHDWGLSDMGRDKNASCLRTLEKLLARLNPHTLVLEAFEGTKERRSERIMRLCRAVVALALNRGIEIAIYTKGEISACFASVGAKSRHEIATALARSFEILHDRLPAPRKSWEGSQRKMALFDAAAAVLTHYQLVASRLFDDLLDQAPN